MTVEGLCGDWDVVQTYSRHEKQLAWKLLDLSVAYCLPLHTIEKKCGGRFRTRHLPIVPGYVFICCADIDTTRARIERESPRSILRFLDVGDQAGLVRDLSALHFAVTEGARVAGDFARPGQRCRVTSGPFKNFEGEIDHTGQHGKVFLTIALLGQTIPFEIDVRQLEPL